VLSRKQIQTLFISLNDRLSQRGEVGEIGIVGGAVMCLVFNARQSTKDIDAIFKPAALIRQLVAQIAEEFNLEPNWLNDAAKGFLSGTFERVDVLNFSHLRVWAPEPRYMLAMKVISARWDTLDRKDVIFLIGLLKLSTKEQVFAIVESFYPKKQIPPKTQFFIEEVLESATGRKKRK